MRGWKNTSHRWAVSVWGNTVTAWWTVGTASRDGSWREFQELSYPSPQDYHQINALQTINAPQCTHWPCCRPRHSDTEEAQDHGCLHPKNEPYTTHLISTTVQRGRGSCPRHPAQRSKKQSGWSRQVQAWLLPQLLLHVQLGHFLFPGSGDQPLEVTPSAVNLFTILLM